MSDVGNNKLMSKNSQDDVERKGVDIIFLFPKSLIMIPPYTKYYSIIVKKSMLCIMNLQFNY